MDEDVLMDDDDRTDEDASMDEDDRTDKDALTNHGMSLKDYIRNRIDSQTKTQEVVKSIGEYQNASYDTELPDDKAVQYILDELINDSAEGVAIKNCVLKRLEMEDKALLRMLLCSLEDLKDLEDDALSFTVAKLRKEDWDRALMHMCIIYHVPIMETFNTAADVLVSDHSLLVSYILTLRSIAFYRQFVIPTALQVP